MATIQFLRHFHTDVDPDTPVDRWTLSPAGERAMDAFLARNDRIQQLDHVFSSPEPKAADTARAIASIADTRCSVVDGLREVDRSGEGFVEPPSRYRELVEAYLRQRTVSFAWEERSAVERRAAHAVGSMIDTLDEGQTAIAVTHGLWLTIVLAPLVGKDRVEFWYDLDFGETVEVGTRTLKREIVR